MNNTIEHNLAALDIWQRMEREMAADRTLLDALIRYQIVATATGDGPGAAWAKTKIAAVNRSCHEKEVTRLVKAVDAYSECSAVGDKGGLARGTQKLEDPDFYIGR